MNGPLEGLRIIDSTTMVAMPTALHLMGDMGAEVIKVDSHTLYRSEMGLFPDNKPGPRYWDQDSSFNALQRSKLGLTLNLQTKQGVEMMRDLVRVSDVLVENNRAGTMDRLGLGWEHLRKVKPDLVYLSNTGFGYTGPWRSYAGIGRMFELTCGLSQVTGYPDEGPRRVGSAFFDLHVGWTAVFALLAALEHRNKTGEGQWIDFSMYQIGVATMGDALLDFIANGRNGALMGNSHPYYAPHGVYPCKGDDKWVAIAIESDQQWVALVKAMGSPEWAKEDRFADAFSRFKHQKALDPLLSQWTAGHEHTEAMNLLQAAGVPAGAVYNAKEELLDPQFKERGFFEKVKHHPDSSIGTRVYVGRPWKMSHAQSFIRRPAPMLGEHNESIVSDLLGHSEDEVEELYDLAVLGKEPVNQQPPGRGQSPERQVELGTLAAYDPDYKKVLGI
ncbi:MAG: CoA transferase [Chloroflexi bacterium]|nr:CoA transferase [Chloroflexota bacterium]